MGRYCSYIGGECERMGNAAECAKQPAIVCRTIRQKLEEEKAERKSGKE